MSQFTRRYNTQNNTCEIRDKSEVYCQSIPINEGTSKNIIKSISFKKQKPKLQINSTIQSKPQLKIKHNTSKSTHTYTTNLSPNSINNDNHQYFPRATKTNFILNKQDINFVPVDPNRLSHYNRSMTGDCNSIGKNSKYIGRIQQNVQIDRRIDRRIDKWDKSLEKYMLARTKMSDFFSNAKHSGQFDHIQLDKKNTIIRNRKLEQAKNKLKVQYSCDKKQSDKTTGPQFVSYLIHNKQHKQRKRNIIIKQIGNGQVRRCDALLVNFVSTYFRRKFYSKKNKKPYSMRRIKTDEDQLVQMVGLEGKTINDAVINDVLGAIQGEKAVDFGSSRQNQYKNYSNYYRRLSIGKSSEKSDIQEQMSEKKKQNVRLDRNNFVIK